MAGLIHPNDVHECKCFQCDMSEQPKTVPTINHDRVATANRVLATFAPDTTIGIQGGHVQIVWHTRAGKSYSKRWVTRGQDFYPVWHNKWPHGGTASYALSQLVRWIRDKPVLGIGSWKYWASESVKLLRHGDVASVLDQFVQAGYPSVSTCVLCGNTGHCGDWWSLDGVSGPCCRHNSGCRKKAAENG